MKVYPGNHTSPGSEPGLEKYEKEVKKHWAKPKTDSREMRQTRVDWRVSGPLCALQYFLVGC